MRANMLELKDDSIVYILYIRMFMTLIGAHDRPYRYLMRAKINMVQ